MPTSVASGVQTLRRAKCIDDAEVTAAERFSKDWLFAIEGVRDPLQSPGGGAGNPHDVQIARAAAMTCHRVIADAIGAAMTERLVKFVVLDFTFVAMAALFTPGRANGRIEMRGSMATLLVLLSRQYAALDQLSREKSRRVLKR
jgi:hypothetical protein